MLHRFNKHQQICARTRALPSATTADAVMSLNAEDGGSRQYIMVQLHEPTREGTAAHEKGYRFIDDISRARIEKAAAKIKKENPLLADTQDLGFKHYRVVKPEQPTLDAINNYDPNQIELFNDMISPFSGESLHVPGNATGIDTILTTYLVQDGYKFDEQVTDLNLAGYDSSYVGKTRVYLIAEHWGSEQTKALVNLIGTNAITVQTVIVYGYSFAMESMRELEIALSQLETKVNLVVRY
jgi:adenine-specific DNA-methyltransferase